MGQHDRHHQRQPDPPSQSLTPKTDAAEIRMKAVSLCYRPDKSPEQIIDFADKLAKYILNGQPEF